MKKRIFTVLLALAMLLTLSACGAGQQPKVYEVRFELNGGTLVSGQLLQHVTEGGAAVAPEAEREGYELSGWDGAIEAVTENTVAVARWTKLPEPSAAPAVYEVRFELNGGSLVSGHLLQHVTEGAAAEAPVLEREGYVLDGWSESFDAVTENVVAAAMWAKLYRVTFDPAGGQLPEGQAEQWVKAGQLPEAPEPTRSNYSFAGWNPTLSAATEDTVYTAAWDAVKLSSEQVFDKISPSVVEVAAFEPSGEYYSLGSGFFIDDSGRFVTNYHVIDGTVSGKIAMQDGTEYDIVSVLGYDPTLDLAVLQADVSGNPYLTISDLEVTTGETIYALGSSEGLTSTFSTGIVSSASRDMEGVMCIQITAPISHGNSGGPLVNVFGEVVGVNTMTLIEGQNLNFAIDIDELEKLDLSGSMTLAEVYAVMHPADPGSSGSSSSGGSSSEKGFYGDTEYAEEEPNDSFMRADQMPNGSYIAGEVANVEDLDWFYVEVTKPCDVSFEVAPAYIDDMDYLLCGVFRLSDEEGTELMTVLEAGENNGFHYMSGTVHFDQPGVYLLLICMDDAYPYSEPLYYAASAQW